MSAQAASGPGAGDDRRRHAAGQLAHHYGERLLKMARGYTEGGERGLQDALDIVQTVYCLLLTRWRDDSIAMERVLEEIGEHGKDSPCLMQLLRWRISDALWLHRHQQDVRRGSKGEEPLHSEEPRSGERTDREGVRHAGVEELIDRQASEHDPLDGLDPVPLEPAASLRALGLSRATLQVALRSIEGESAASIARALSVDGARVSEIQVLARLFLLVQHIEIEYIRTGRKDSELRTTSELRAGLVPQECLAERAAAWEAYLRERVRVAQPGQLGLLAGYLACTEWRRIRARIEQVAPEYLEGAPDDDALRGRAQRLVKKLLGGISVAALANEQVRGELAWPDGEFER